MEELLKYLWRQHRHYKLMADENAKIVEGTTDLDLQAARRKKVAEQQRTAEKWLQWAQDLDNILHR